MGGVGVAGQSLLRRKAQEELDKAKQFTVQKNKRAALMCLKKKKMYETQADQVRGCGLERVGACASGCGLRDKAPRAVYRVSRRARMRV